MPAAREPSLADPPMDTQLPGVSSRRWTRLLLLIFTLAGAWLRLSHLGTKSLWLDEGATVALARTSWQHFAWVWWHGEANLQSLYFLLMRAWIYAGFTETLLRLPSALFGIASIPLMFLVARRWLSPGYSLLAAALLAFSPAHVEYSQQARSYTLAILLVLLSTYFFVRAVEEGRSRDWVLWTLLGILAFCAHDFAALVLVAQACSLFFKAPPRPWKPLLIGAAVIFVAALPGLTYVFRASPENLNFAWMAKPSLRELWHLARFFGGGGVKVALALVLWVAGVVAVVSARKRAPDKYWHGMLAILWAALPVAIVALISLRHPLFVHRYMIFSLPGTILLAAMGAAELRKWRAGLVCGVLLCGISLPTIVSDYSKPREDWRSASNSIFAFASPGDAVVFFPFYTRIMLDYYAARYPVDVPKLRVYAPGFYAGGDDVSTLLKALDADPHRFRRVWVVLYGADAKIGNFDHGSDVEQQLRPIFGAPQVKNFTDVQILKYGQ
jgi:mannosyltransferase